MMELGFITSKPNLKLSFDLNCENKFLELKEIVEHVCRCQNGLIIELGPLNEIVENVCQWKNIHRIGLSPFNEIVENVCRWQNELKIGSCLTWPNPKPIIHPTTLNPNKPYSFSSTFNTFILPPCHYSYLFTSIQNMFFTTLKS